MEMDKDVIKLDVNLTPEDLYVFQKHILKNAFKPSTIIAISIVFIAITLNIITSEIVLIAKALALILMVLLIFIFIFSLFGRLRKSSANALKDNKLAQQTQKFTISAEHIQVESGTGYSKIEWTDLYKAEETKESFLLFISKQQAYIIAKRYFEADAKQHDLMRRFIQKAPVPRKEKRSGLSILWRLLIYFGIFLVVLAFVVYFNSL